MSIQDLTSSVVPPSSPVDSDDSTWVSAQRRLNLQLPDDLREFGTSFGTGEFVVESIRIEVFNPLSKNYMATVEEHLAILAGNKGDDGPKRFPYELHPDRPGLLPWGSDIDGNELVWLTDGDVNEWPIVIRSEDGDFEEFGGPLTTFLASVFQGTVKVAVWPSQFFANGVLFESASKTRSEVAPSNIYEIYESNGSCEISGCVTFVLKRVWLFTSRVLPETKVDRCRELQMNMEGPMLKLICTSEIH